jgi:hypothetical protein
MESFKYIILNDKIEDMGVICSITSSLVDMPINLYL